MNLRAAEDPAELFRDLEGPLVLVADEITPSVIAQLDWQRLAALVTDAGSWTYHTAILARSIQVPAVAGLHNASISFTRARSWRSTARPATCSSIPTPQHSRRSAPASSGSRPTSRRSTSFALCRRSPRTASRSGSRRTSRAPTTRCARTERGAAGIGLFRSEFLLAGAGQSALTEEAQYTAYRRLVESAAPGRVTVRTFDVSETQLPIDHAGFAGARAPLGLRGIRLSLALDEIFQAQLRALLRAAAHGSLRIMFPFVSGSRICGRRAPPLNVRPRRCAARGEPAPRVPIGVMIEVPSAALTADLLAAEADFFSIGTNDLIQYCLAVDRTDERVSGLYEPLHPAILRMVRLVARAGRRGRIPVAVCGEMAADPALLTLLVGLGLREFSMAPASMPAGQAGPAQSPGGRRPAAAARALEARTAAEVEQTLIELLAPQHQL